MRSEHKSLTDNKTWSLVARPADKKILSGKWVYKLKKGPNGEILRHKARWVVRGFEQTEGIDYNETFASVVKPMSYKAIFAIAAALDLELEQMDVKTAFLYGNIDGEVYLEQPPEFDDGTGRVCKLNKALYGLKQAPRIWYQTLTTFLEGLGFYPLTSDVGIFVKGHTYIAVYVDDLLIAGPSKEEIQKLKNALSNRFQMTDLGPCNHYLGMAVTRDRRNRTIRLSQKGYIEKVLKDFGMCEAKPQYTPMKTDQIETPEDYEPNDEIKTCVVLQQVPG
ncbi:reverse transcriptase (RNA-dependent DNA polymerase) [Hirsutella rhossiliensis]